MPQRVSLHHSRSVAAPSTQSLRLRIFSLVLEVTNLCLLLHRAILVVRATDRARLGLFNVNICVVWLSLTEKQLLQGVMDPESVAQSASCKRTRFRELPRNGELLSLSDIRHAVPPVNGNGFQGSLVIISWTRRKIPNTIDTTTMFVWLSNQVGQATTAMSTWICGSGSGSEPSSPPTAMSIPTRSQC